MRRFAVLALVLMLSSSGCLGFGDGADKNEENIGDIIDEIDNKIDQEKNNTEGLFSEPVWSKFLMKKVVIILIHCIVCYLSHLLLFCVKIRIV